MRRGRPSCIENEWRISKIINVLASLQQRKGDILRFSDIHEEFVKAGIVSNIKHRGNTRRILRQLIEKGYLEQVERGKYRLKIMPKPFQVTELIREIREKYGGAMIYEWKVGGHLWTLVEGIIFGLPHNIEENPIYKAVLEFLLIRLANIFHAIVELGITAKISKDIKKAPIPYTAIREFILNSLPHIIGEYSGIDGDGLPARDIAKLYKILIRHIPGEVNGQPILVDVIKEYVDIGEKLLNKSVNISELIDKALIESGEDKEVWRKIRELEKIVLVIYPPRHLIDENEDERELYELLRHSIEEGYSDAMLLAHMRVYDEEVVERVMNYLEPILGKERKNRLMQLYKLRRAGMILDGIIATYFSFKEKKGKVTEINKFADKIEEEVLSELKRELDYVRRYGYTLKDMIKGIWLSDWPHNIVPRFTDFYYVKDFRDIVVFVKESIKETLEAVGVKIPRNFDALVNDSYILMKELDELLQKDNRRVLTALREVLQNER
ncbi:MAG TPA: hypothetical protein ENG44_00890 [Desulfurococcaceae archaeon]|nr:hypothetical protein [Desulfurococcaceae archaeon]